MLFFCGCGVVGDGGWHSVSLKGGDIVPPGTSGISRYKPFENLPFPVFTVTSGRVHLDV